ncbi:MAG TPA: hypothetical protein VHB74_09270 [Devosia sp.]|nr:hypothetical protein [Devosia sp.]
MTPTNYREDVLPQDTSENDSAVDIGPGTGQPLSEAEIDDLLYGEGRSTGERLELLRVLRDDLLDRQGGDFGEDDPGDLIAEIDARITELENDEETGEAGVYDSDPLAHRETLAPDSDELEELDEEEEDSLDEEDDWLDAEERAEEHDSTEDDLEEEEEEDEEEDEP